MFTKLISYPAILQKNMLGGSPCCKSIIISSLGWVNFILFPFSQTYKLAIEIPIINGWYKFTTVQLRVELEFYNTFHNLLGLATLQTCFRRFLTGQNLILFNSIVIALLLNYLARFAKFQKMTHPTLMYTYNNASIWVLIFKLHTLTYSGYRYYTVHRTKTFTI